MCVGRHSDTLDDEALQYGASPHVLFWEGLSFQSGSGKVLPYDFPPSLLVNARIMY